MRLARFGDNRLGLVEGYVLRDVTRATEQLPALRWPFPPGDQLIANLDRLHCAVNSAADAAPRLPATEVKLLSPVANPPRIFAAPFNYRTRDAEPAGPGKSKGADPSNGDFATPVDKHGLILKSPTGVAGAGEGITLGFPGRRTDFEMELAVVIGERAKDLSGATDALRCIAGYCIGLDITAHGAENPSFRKSADSYTVLGPWLVTADEIPDPNALGIRLAMDGELRQDGNTRDMIVSVPELVERASRAFTLHPGDVILTGTPAGVGPLRSGSTLRATIDGIGAMDVRVR